MTIDTRIRLDDLGLFKRRRKGEVASQYERAAMLRDQFAECMDNALKCHYCCMPYLCAHNSTLDCAHLVVDDSSFTLKGVPGASRIPLTKHSAKKINDRLRAIGTLVYRQEVGASKLISFPGDVFMPALGRINTFGDGRKMPARAKAKAKPAAAKKAGGFLAWLIG